MITLGLQRITQLLSPLFAAHPNLPWRAVHIAGTNGKGSVAALISTFLGHLGYSVGRFTSPHLIDRWDCITINRNVVEREKFLRIEEHFRDRSVTENVGASNFEILTATAFQLFTDQKVDVAVVECGLGGRQDATNVLRQQDVILSVLTKVGLDHTEFLGNTIEAIAAEKAGIFKPGVPVVLDQSNEPSVIKAVTKRFFDLGWGEDGSKAVYVSLEEQGRLFSEPIQRLGLADHQAQNLYTAWTSFQRVAESLSDLRPGRKSSSSYPFDSARASLEKLITEAQSSLPGRLQWLTLPPQLSPPEIPNITTTKILLDGAHNVQSATGLSDFIARNLRTSSSVAPSKPITWLLAVKSDKDPDQILSILLQPHDNVVTCSFGPVDGMPWVVPMSARELADKVRTYTDGVVRAVGHDEGAEGLRAADDSSDGDALETPRNSNATRAIREAVRIADQQAGDGARLCITGSLYLVGDVLRCVRDAGGSIYGD